MREASHRRLRWRAIPAGIGCVLGSVVLLACGTRLGPRTIPGARFDYNQRIARSQNDQLLLNLVRLRYRDTPVFLDVGTVIAQYTLDASVDVLPTLNVEGSGNTELGVDLGGRYSEQPTITYEPISGAEFTRRLLTPMTAQTIILLSQSGWSIERLLMCCVDSINGVTNAPVASGPTPSRIPDNSQFRETARLLRELQVSGVLNFMLSQDRESGETSIRVPKPESDPERAEILSRVREILKLDDGHETFRLTTRSARLSSDAIVLTGRSLLGALFFLSHSVDPPATHETKGLVTVMAPGEGNAQDWDTVSGNLLKVSSAESPPTEAFVRIRYRDHWFYIEDADLNSKATFNLLTYLLSLQSAGQGGIDAMLTVPVGQ